ncbi:hypothetical protein ACSMXN_24315 [Jatrophihabitans sp. DSM 45814]
MIELITEVDADRRPPRRPNRVVIALALLVVLIGVGLVNHNRAQTKTAQPTVAPSAKVHRDSPAVAPIALPGRAVDLVSGGDMVFALTASPPMLTRLEPLAPHAVLATAIVPTGAVQLVLDSQTNRLWTLQREGPRQTVVYEYDPLSLSQLSRQTVDVGVTTAVAYNSQLWLGTDRGLYLLPVENGADSSSSSAEHNARPQPVKGLNTSVRSLVFDPASDRVIASTAAGSVSTLTTIDGSSFHVLVVRQVPIGEISFAWTEHGLWAAGSRPEGSGIIDLIDPVTLQVIATAPSTRLLDGSIAVWPGDGVFWSVEKGIVSCLSARTGGTLTTTTDLSAPVVPGLGVAYAIGSQTVQVLDLTDTDCKAS